jgi:hypothetical protein
LDEPVVVPVGDALLPDHGGDLDDAVNFGVETGRVHRQEGHATSAQFEPGGGAVGRHEIKSLGDAARDTPGAASVGEARRSSPGDGPPGPSSDDDASRPRI